jgi:hypothetical protein
MSIMKLKDYLMEIGVRPYPWSKAKKLNKNTVYGLYHGTLRVKLETAIRISQATGGAVSIEELALFD